MNSLAVRNSPTPDVVGMVLDGLSSQQSIRAYARALNDFIGWIQDNNLPFVKAGETYSDISKQLELSYGTVYYIAVKYDLRDVTRKRRKERLTEVQESILDAINSHWMVHNLPPTQQQIVDTSMTYTKSNVTHAMEKLERLGYIILEKRKPIPKWVNDALDLARDNRTTELLQS